MPSQSSKIANQLQEFINTSHVYTDGISEETIEKIRCAADKEPEDTVPTSITKRKGKSRRSIVSRYPSEWATSKEEFLRAVEKFEYLEYSQSPVSRTC